MIRPLNMVWARPKTTALVLTLLALFGTGLGLYVYALRQWDVAQAALKEDRPSDARASLDFCLLVWPYSIPAHLLAARRARMAGDFAGAEAELQRCMRLQKGASEDVQIEFLLMRVQRGQVDDVADELFQHVENKSPQSFMIMETIARAYMDKFRYGPALACLDRWIEAKPDEAKPYHWRGWVLERLDETDSAMKDYQQAIHLNPGLIAARLRLAEILLEKSDPPGALEYLEPLSRQFPDRPDVIALLGRCRFLEGQMEEARRLMEAAVKQRPDDGPLLSTLAKLNLADGRPADAEQWARQALRSDVTDTEAENILAASLRAQDRQKEANAVQEQHEKDAATMRKVNRLLGQSADPQHPIRDAGDFYEIGALFLHAGNERQGEYWLHRALEIAPGHQPSLKVLSEYYDGKGDKEKAAAYRGRLVEAEGKANPAFP